MHLSSGDAAALTMIVTLFAALFAIDWWRKRCWRRWDEMVSKEDRSLAGAMERSKRRET